MTEAGVPAETLATIEIIARAIRHELGEEADAYPGCRSPEGADPLNRAFRAVARSLLAAAGVPAGDLGASLSRALLLVATGRLEAGGWDGHQVKDLIEGEPGSPDDWLGFLALASRPQI